MKLRTEWKWVLGVAALSFGLSTAFAADDVKALYDKQCKKCHGVDGSGKKDGEWMPVIKTLKLDKPEKLSIISAEAKALKDEDIMKSMTDGKDKMKSLKEKLSEAEMKSLVEYTRKLQKEAK